MQLYLDSARSIRRSTVKLKTKRKMATQWQLKRQNGKRMSLQTDLYVCMCFSYPRSLRGYDFRGPRREQEMLNISTQPKGFRRLMNMWPLVKTILIPPHAQDAIQSTFCEFLDSFPERWRRTSSQQGKAGRSVNYQGNKEIWMHHHDQSIRVFK